MKFKFLVILSLLLVGCGSNTNSKEFSYSDIYNEQGYFKDVEASEVAGTIDYTSFEIDPDLLEVTESEIESTLSSFYQYYTPEVKKITDRKIVDGDTVNIDFVGSVDGVEFEGGSTKGEGTSITIGLTTYIDDFLDQLIGHTPGDEMNINVTFPDDYSQEDLQGKDAVFVTQINYIEETIIDDAYVKDNFESVYGWTTVSEMRAGVEAELRLSNVKNYLYEVMMEMELAKDLPTSLITYQQNIALAFYQSYADSYEMELEDFLTSYAGYESIDAMHEAESETNIANAKFSTIALAIAAQENMAVTTDDLEVYFAKQMGSSDYSEYEETYGLPYINHIVLCEMVLDHLYNTLV